MAIKHEYYRTVENGHVFWSIKRYSPIDGTEKIFTYSSLDQLKLEHSYDLLLEIRDLLKDKK